MKKISQLSTDEGLDVLIEIAPNVINITSDENLMKQLQAVVSTEKLTKAQMMLLGAQKIGAIVPILLKDHRDDVYNILACMTETSIKDIEKQSLLKTIKQITEIIRDKELVDFFTDCME